MEAWQFAVSAFMAIVTLGGLVWAGGWAVSRITTSLDALSARVHELAKSVSDLDTKIDDHAERLARVEERMTGGTP